MKYTHLKKQNAEAFRRYTGLTPDVFNAMLDILKEAYQQKHARGGRKPKLSVADQLLMTLSYYREYRTQFHLAQDYHISESSVCKTIKWVEETLVKHPSLTQVYRYPVKKNYGRTQILKSYSLMLPKYP